MLLSLAIDMLCIVCRRGDLLHALTLLDEEEDINKVLKYFSYEHFYVIYCKVKVYPLCLMFASQHDVICREFPREWMRGTWWDFLAVHVGMKMQQCSQRQMCLWSATSAATSWHKQLGGAGEAF